LLHAAAGLAAASFGLSTACGKTYCGWGVGQDEPVDAGSREEGDSCATCEGDSGVEPGGRVDAGERDAGPSDGADAGADAGDAG
jgi:hypothetical protein